MNKLYKRLVPLVLAAVISVFSVPHTDANASSQVPELNSLGLIPDSPETIAQDKINLKSYRSVFPDVYDNSSLYPIPGNQGSQGSCTAWAVAYAYKTYQENLEHQWGADSPSTQFSPAYVYNQLNNGVDNGVGIAEALQLLADQGVCTLDAMPYNQNDYLTQPNLTQRIDAYKNRARSYYSISMQTDVIKTAIQDFGGVVIGIPIYNDFDTLNDTNNQVYDIVSGNLRGWHAVCLVGWDESKRAFKLINSWDTNWGQDGFGYISYDLITGPNSIYGYIMTDKQGHEWYPHEVPSNFHLGENVLSISGGMTVKGVFTPSETSEYTFETSNNSGDPVMALYADPALTARLAYDDESAPNHNAKFSYDLEANTTYYVAVKDYYHNPSTLTLTIGKASSPSSSLELGTNSITLQQGIQSIKTFRTTESGEYIFVTGNNSHDPTLALYSDEALTNRIAYDDDNGGNRNALFTVQLSANTTYYAVINEYQGRPSTLDLTIRLNSIIPLQLGANLITLPFGLGLTGSFTPSQTSEYTMITSNNTANPVLELYTDQALTNRLAYDDDGAGDLNSKITYTLNSNTTYYVVIKDVYNLASAMTLTIS